MNDMNKPIGNVMPNQPGTGNQALYDGPMKQYSDQLNQASNFSQGMMMKSPLKQLSSEALVSPFKMDDLSGDGKITQKDVLIGRGVIDKEGSPLTNKDNPRKEARTLAGKNFKSERRMAGFAEDTESNKARFESPRVKTKINKKDITKNIKKS